MKPSTLNDYAKRIDRAIELLTRSLEGHAAPSLEELADAAAMSKFHFHRVFRLMTGETVNEAVTRIRLARGTAAASGSTVTTAAAEAGYGTSQSFARAMRSRVGVSVSEAVKSLDLGSLFAAPNSGSPLSVELVELQPLQVLALRNRGDYRDLDQVYGRLFEIAGGPGQVEAIYGLLMSDPRFEAPGDCEFEAALKLTSLPGELSEASDRTIDGGHFLKLRHIGDYDLIPLALDQLTLAAMVDDGIELRGAPPLVHYLDDPEETPEAELRADVHLPVNIVLSQRALSEQMHQPVRTRG